MIFFTLSLIYELTSQICDIKVTVSNASKTYYDYDLTGSIKQCETHLQYIIDFNFYDIPDKFEVIIDNEVLLTSELIGNQDSSSMFTFEGFVQYRLLKNSDHIIYFLANIPSNYELDKSQKIGAGRLILDTDSTNPIFRVYSSSSFSVYVHCKFENKIVRTDTISLCRTPYEAREYVTTVNCDTIIVDSIDVSSVGLEITDTVTITSNALDAGFYILEWVDNEYGCKIPWRVRHVIKPAQSVYIPNVFAPNGSGLNTIFEVAHLAHYRIKNRSGAIIYDSDQGWNGENAEAGVYIYEIIVNDERFVGDVTLIR